MPLPPLPEPPKGPAIRAVGVIGNSGEAGPSLVRTATYPANQRPGGAAVAADGTLWVSGGDRVLHLSLSGQLLERFELEPAGSTVESRTFAAAGGTLHFLGTAAGRGGRGATLFALPMCSGARAKPLPVELPRRKRDWIDYVLAPQPLGRELVIVNEPPDDEPPGGDRLDVVLIDPATGAVRKAFSLVGDAKAGPPHGAAVDEAEGIVYIGAHAISAVSPGGSGVGGAFPIPCMKTPAIPTQFRGVISLAGGALWDAAWYGFMSRHSKAGANAPGRVVEWHHELDYPSQVVGLGDGHARYDPLFITCAAPGAWYFARWDRRRERLELARRLGCMPDVMSLGLSGEGWVTVSTARTQLWWRWEDGPDSPPRKADIHLAVTPPHFEGDAFVAAAAQYELKPGEKRPLTLAVFEAKPGDRNEARRVVQELPFAEPVGLSARVFPGKKNAVLYITDAAKKGLWAIDLWRPELRPDAATWREVPVEGDPLKAPTDVAALTDGRLLLADAGRILMLEPEGEGFRLGWELASWGEGPADRFGGRLRMSASGSWMLVSDAERHRLVWLDWTARKVVAVFGETDRAGDDLGHLDSPAQVALEGARAVVADSGNQRIVKLSLSP